MGGRPDLFKVPALRVSVLDQKFVGEIRQGAASAAPSMIGLRPLLASAAGIVAAAEAKERKSVAGFQGRAEAMP